MANIGPLEIGIVLIIALIVFGPKKLPELGNSLGKGIREFKGSIGGEEHDEKHPPAEIESAPASVAASAPAEPTGEPSREKQHA